MKPILYFLCIGLFIGNWSCSTNSADADNNGSANAPSFEVLLPKMRKLAVNGPSPELQALQKKQKAFGGLAFLTAIVILVLSSMMRYIG